MLFLLFSPAFVIAYFYKRQLAKNVATKTSANIQKKESKIKCFGIFFFQHPLISFIRACLICLQVTGNQLAKQKIFLFQRYWESHVRLRLRRQGSGECELFPPTGFQAPLTTASASPSKPLPCFHPYSRVYIE